MPKKTFFAVLIALYLVSAGASFAVFRSVLPGAVGSINSGNPSRFAQLISPLVPSAGEGAVNVEEGAPRTEECPLNGAMYSVAERESWENRTPIAIMIENHTDARPQSGLANSDVVFEAIAEGGITRFMAIVYCNAQAQDVILAPVRSARTYFLDWASTYQKPLYTHVGGANLPGPTDALGQLSEYGWVGKNNLNQFSIGFPTFARNYNRIELANGKALATEHTMETSSERLWNYAEENRNITSWAGASEYEPWSFKDDAETDGSVTDISHNFWDGYKDFQVDWAYQAESNSYARTMGGEAHVDLNTNEQIAAKNVIVMFMSEKGPINENKHMLYGTTGSGKALIFLDGEAVDATWTKPSRTGALSFTVRGQDVELNRGLTWISVVATGTDVEY